MKVYTLPPPNLQRIYMPRSNLIGTLRPNILRKTLQRKQLCGYGLLLTARSRRLGPYALP